MAYFGSEIGKCRLVGLLMNNSEFLEILYQVLCEYDEDEIPVSQLSDIRIGNLTEESSALYRYMQWRLTERGIEYGNSRLPKNDG
mgnify:FL=1